VKTWLFGAVDSMVESLGAVVLPVVRRLGILQGAGTEPVGAGTEDGHSVALEDRPARILIVEDDESTSRLLRTHLNRSDYDVRKAANGREALQIVTSIKPDLILLDLGLPDMDGHKLSRKLRQMDDLATVPIIIITGRATMDSRVKGYEHGADDYMLKPIDLTELDLRIWSLLRRTQERRLLGLPKIPSLRTPRNESPRTTVVQESPAGEMSALPIPTRQYAILSYFVAICVVEVLTVFVNWLEGLLIHALLLICLIIISSLSSDTAYRRFTLSVAFAPLIRLISLAIPLADFDPIYWYPMTTFPILVAAIMTIQLIGVSPPDVGLRITMIPRQLLVACTGVLFGFVGYALLSPEPLTDSLSLSAIWIPALILLVSTGITEELVFRGLIQYTATQFVGPMGIVYAAGLLAVLHIGNLSAVEVLFTFATGLFYGWVVSKTGSLSGVMLAHGLTIIVLLLIAPFVPIPLP